MMHVLTLFQYDGYSQIISIIIIFACLFMYDNFLTGDVVIIPCFMK